MRLFYSPAASGSSVNAVEDDARRFFSATWRSNGEVAYGKTGTTTNPTYQFQALNEACGVNLLWTESATALQIPAGISPDSLPLYFFDVPGEPSYAIQIHPDAQNILTVNGIGQGTAAYILYPKWTRADFQTGVLSVASGNAIAFGPTLATSGGEGTVWQMTDLPSFQPLLDLVGPTHELFHLIGRVTHLLVSPPFPYQFSSDSAWLQLYSPLATPLGGTFRTWDGQDPGGQVLLDRPFNAPGDAEHWMTTVSVELAPLQYESQCQVMRSDPANYLVQASPPARP